MALTIYNTLSRRQEAFIPLKKDEASMYVCGPTVYDKAHLGNARPNVVFDILFRLLRFSYNTRYVRNITDIDDKIIAASKTSGLSIHEITTSTTKAFHKDMQALKNLSPTDEPKATEHIEAMLSMIEDLVAKNHAYVADGHVLFDVGSCSTYGRLSKRKQDEMIAGARVEIAPYKKNPMDFVLWKPSSPDIPGWESPWGRGRPGWHIECSAMSFHLLGKSFDIHGGGQDLIFPHHENEIAQSICSHGENTFARYWVHNGILTVNGEKMSKSLGNFITVNDLLQKTKGEVVRFALLSTHYRQPLDWTDTTLEQARTVVDRFYNTLRSIDLANNFEDKQSEDKQNKDVDQGILEALEDDLNTPKAISRLHELAYTINMASEKEKRELQYHFRRSASILGLFQDAPEEWFQKSTENLEGNEISKAEIESLIQERLEARKLKNFKRSDEIRDNLAGQGIILEDQPHGTIWRRK
jgi:cysteinyl-tRNA synthetase